MNEKEKIINETVSIMEKVQNEKVLRNMLNLVKLSYNNNKVREIKGAD